MTQDQYVKIVEYAQLLNSNIPQDSADDELLMFVVNEVVDRVLLFLNADTLDDNLLRVVAGLVVSAYNKADATSQSTGTEKDIQSVTDNGQTVRFTDYKAYFANPSDDEVMDGFTNLLKRYRRVQIVGE